MLSNLEFNWLTDSPRASLALVLVWINLSIKLSKLDFIKGVVEVDNMGEHGIGNPKGLNDLGKDGWVEDLELYRKNFDDSSTSDCK